MKLKHLILFFSLILAACSTRHPVETRFIASQNDVSPYQQLQAIDSLMWRQPDSALMVLVDFATTPKADSLSAFEGHYCQMLLSELLYKNYQPQLNREDLLKAVDYFDSIVGVDETDARNADTRGVSLRERNAFLDARAHYINGAGLYEQGSVVEACAEYLKALEVMEGHFGEEDLVKNKAKFMAYTYNRLGDMFSGQFMMEAAITCYENVLAYCKIETTSPTGVSNALTRLGLQYEKLKDTKKMRAYYSQALEEMPDSDNLSYRDMTAAIALCDYKIDSDADRSLETLRHILSQAADENERLTRYLTIGAIFSHEEMYDSAVAYLEPVFRNTNDEISQIQAAEYLRKIYESLGNEAKLNECISFLVNRKASASENKALVSQLDNLFQGFVKQKQGKQTEAEHTKHIKRIVGIIVPIIVLLVLGVIVIAKLRSNKLLKQQQKEADRAMEVSEQEHEEELRLLQAEADNALEKSKRKHEEELKQLRTETNEQLETMDREHQKWMTETKERHEEELRMQKDLSEKEIEKTRKRHEEELEAERKAYQQKQEVLRQSLQQREEQVNALEKALNQQHEEAARRREAFLKEPICQHIFSSLLSHDKEITSRDAYYEHHAIALNDEDCKQLRQAVEQHYAGFDAVLLGQCTGLKPSDLTLCHLHLMGLSEGVIGALRSRTYSGIKKQNEALEEKMGLEESLAEYVLRVAEQLCGAQNEAISEESTLKSTLKNSVSGTLKGTQKKIVEIIIDNPHISIPQVARQLELNPRGVAKHFKTLQDNGVIRRVGPDKGGCWEVVD